MEGQQNQSKRPMRSGKAADLSKLDTVSLKRYKKNFKLKVRPAATKAELLAVVSKHFQTMPINETDVIEEFLGAINAQDSS